MGINKNIAVPYIRSEIVILAEQAGADEALAFSRASKLFRSCSPPAIQENSFSTLATHRLAKLAPHELFDVLKTLGTGLGEVINAIKIFECFRKFFRTKSPEANSERSVEVPPPAQPRKHAGEVADRLNELRDLLRHRHSELSYAELAEHLGHKDASVLEVIADGETAPGLQTLNEIADKLGVSREWLKFGKSQPFSIIEKIDLDREYREHIKKHNPNNIDFIRSLDESGRAILLLQHDKYKYTILDPLIQVSECRDANDCMHLHRFFNFLTVLKDEYDWGRRFGATAYGRSAPPEAFHELISGKIYPGEVIKKLPVCNWIDDFLDIDWKYFSQNHYASQYGESFTSAQSSVRGHIDYYISDNK